MVRWSHMSNSQENYWGITLLSSLSKLFQTVFRNRLTQRAYGILLDNQTGFKAGYSTMDNVFVLNNVVQWYKLRKYSISTKRLNILKNMYRSVNS